MFISARLFSLLSWLVLLASMVLLGMTLLDAYKRHFTIDQSQSFVFGNFSTEKQSFQTSLQDVVRQHIFGTVPVVKPKPEKPRVVEAPISKLNLKLTGLFAATDPSQGHAMVEIKRGQTGVVKVGAGIGKTGAKLNAVFPDHILIQHRGKLEKVVMKRRSLTLSAPSTLSEQSVSELNIDVKEFEALAEVDPAESETGQLVKETLAAAGQNSGFIEAGLFEDQELTIAQEEKLERELEMELVREMEEQAALERKRRQELRKQRRKAGQAASQNN